MRYVDTGDPDVLDLRTGAGCFLLVGLFAAAAGAGVIACVFIPGEVRGGDDIEWWFGFPFGGAFVVAGLAGAFARWRCVIDRRRGTVDAGWRWLGWRFSPQKRDLEEITEVSIRREVSRGENSNSWVYVVGLENARGRVKLPQNNLRDDAREDAIRIAKFLQVNLSDSTGGRTVDRSPESLGLSLREQHRQSGEPVVVPPMPEAMNSRIETEGSTLTVHIPPRGIRARLVVSVLPLIGFFSFAWYFIGQHLFRDAGADMTPVEWWGFFLFFGAFFGIGPPLGIVLWVLYRVTNRTTVTVDVDRLTIENRSLLSRSRKVLNADEIEELFANRVSDRPDSKDDRKPGILIRTTGALLDLGGQLPDEERAYLAALMKSVLVA